jgi:alkylhydroperoxidase family enzyme
MRPANPRHPLPPRLPGRPKGRNALGTLARNPELMQAFNTFNGYILFASSLSPRQRELLVLRVASIRRSEYEWAQHAILAGDAGIDEVEVDRVASGPDAPGWAPEDRALLRAVDELVGDGKVTDDTWTALATELDEHQLMDLVFTVGAYDLLAMAFRTFDIELDEDLIRP